MAVRIASILFVLTLGGCDVGDITEGTGTADGNNTAAMTFESMVKPLLTTCVPCHAGVQPPDLTGYTKLVDRYKVKPSTANILVTKGPHQNAAWFTTAQQMTVAAWVDSL